MSVQLAKNETMLREFEYARGGAKVSKKIRVTNKRIIQEETAGKSLAIRREMPIADAKYVETAFGKTSKGARLCWGLILLVLGAAAVALSFLTDFGVDLFDITTLNLVVTGVGGLVAFIGLILFFAYFSSRQAVLKCVISTDHIITPALSISEAPAVSSNKPAREITLDLRISRKAALVLVNELGAAILDAQAYVEEPAVEEAPVVEETPVVEEAPAAEEAPAVEEAPAAEEAPAVEETEAPAEEAVELVAEEVAVEAVEEAAEEVAVEVTEEVAEEAAEEAVEEVAPEAAEEVVKEIEVSRENIAAAIEEAISFAEASEDSTVQIEITIDKDEAEDKTEEA